MHGSAPPPASSIPCPENRTVPGRGATTNRLRTPPKTAIIGRKSVCWGLGEFRVSLLRVRESSRVHLLRMTGGRPRPGAVALLQRLLRAGLALALAAPLFAAAAARAPAAAPAPAAAQAASAAAEATAEATWSHAFATYGEPKYPRGFTHFDYVNPDAPKGGTLYLANPDRRTSFDKFNPFTIKGLAPAGVMNFMFETLTVAGADEPGTVYGLLAEAMLVAPDLSSITFRIHPKAAFNNGDPVTAADVKYSFDVLTSKLADPIRRSRLSGTASATIVDARTVRFDLKERAANTIINLGTRMPVFSRKWGAGPDGNPKPFDQIIHEHPITTGPYKIDRTDSGRRIDFERRPDYWARDVGATRGFFNFDRVVYRYYQDRAVTMEAFKAGEFDLIQEFSARRWARSHEGAKWRDGRIRKQVFVNGFGAGLQAYFLNLRRPLFQDRRVREALNYTYDFNMVNTYRQYTRTKSIFSNSEFAATGAPGPGELALLEPFRAQLPPEVFGPAWEPPRTDTGPNAVRENLLKARALLEQAGWKIAADGKLRNARGEAFEFEYLEDIGRSSRFEAAWRRNFDKLGINMKEREVDYAIMTKRTEAFDFDMVKVRTTDFTLPKIGELRDQYSSATADQPGSNNVSGVKHPAVDHLLDTMARAQTLEALRDACRALDRVIIWNFYAVPDLYSGTYRMSYWDKFGMPDKLPKNYTMDSALDIWPAIAITTWWIKDPAKR